MAGALALWLALSLPSAASFAAASASPPSAVGAASPIQVAYHFAGSTVDAKFVKHLAPDPVLAFGATYNAVGFPLDGELWLIVSKAGVATYYDLIDTPASDKASYAGYAVRIEAVATQQTITYGSGAGVPAIGNDTDAFFLSTKQIWASSRFYGAPTRCVSIAGEPCTQGYTLIAVGSELFVSTIPASSDTPTLALLLYAPDGTLVSQQISAPGIPDSTGPSSSTSCADVGKGVADKCKAVQDTWFNDMVTAQSWLNAAAGGITGGIAGVLTGGEDPRAAAANGSVGAMGGALAGAAFETTIVGPVMSVNKNTAQAYENAVVQGMVTGACEAYKLIHQLKLPDLNDLGIKFTVQDCSTTSQCEELGTQTMLDGSSRGTYTTSDGETFEEDSYSYQDETTCAQSRVVFSCADPKHTS